jgi:hypothetical protein
MTSGTFDHTFNLSTDLTGISVSDFITGLEAGSLTRTFTMPHSPLAKSEGNLLPSPAPSSVLACPA